MPARDPHRVVDKSGLKYETIRRAAVLACVPISPSHYLEPMDNQGLQTWQRLKAAYDSLVPSASWATKDGAKLEKDNGPVYHKLAYAMAHTDVDIIFYHSTLEPPLVPFIRRGQWDPASPEPPEFMPGREIGRQDPIHVKVTYDMKLLPGLIQLSRFFRSEISSPKIQSVTSGNKQYYTYRLTASAMLNNEGDKSAVPYVH